MTVSDQHVGASDTMRCAAEMIRQAHATAVKALAMIDESVDPQAGLDLANELVEPQRELLKWTTQLRQRLVSRIWHSERMTLAELARRANVSKGRADQIVRRIKQKPEEAEESR